MSVIGGHVDPDCFMSLKPLAQPLPSTPASPPSPPVRTVPLQMSKKIENSRFHFLLVPSFQQLLSSLSNIMKESKIQKTSQRSSCFKAR